MTLWRIRNALRWRYIKGWLACRLAPIAGTAGLLAAHGELRAVHIRGGKRTDYGVVSRQKVTTAFVNFMCAQLAADTTEWGDFKYHDSGVGATGEANGDTAMETTDGESRATGTQVASTNTYTSVGTISYTTTKAITEHGVFSSAASTTLMDRSVFTAINVVSGDSIEFTYVLTATAGG
jgi:hypothetical protein